MTSAACTIADLKPSRMVFDLKRMRTALHVLGNPQNAFPAVHVAGTNGKGSVCATIAAALNNAGMRTGLYTSPHLERVHERFHVNGCPIGTPALNRLCADTMRRLKRGAPHVMPLTQFEFLTALAFRWFAERHVDIAVVETGLGGRLDATNTLGHVLVSVITNIGRDHTEWLGTSLREIAGEKAGIIRPGVPIVTGATGTALSVIAGVAKGKQAPLIRVSRSDVARVPSCVLRHPGPSQRDNAAIALKTLDVLNERGIRIAEDAALRAIRTTHWPGRFERLRPRRPQDGPAVILDGAHNPDAARALAETLRATGISAIDILFGVLRDKNYDRMIRTLAPFARHVICVPVPSDRSADPAALAAHPAWRTRATTGDRLDDAWRRLKEKSHRGPVLITGSLYLIGACRKLLRRRGYVTTNGPGKPARD